MRELVVAGGARDPNLEVLLRHAGQSGIATLDLRIGAEEKPAFHWDLDEGTVSVAGYKCAPTGAFIRYDVFENLANPSPDAVAVAGGWFTALQAWATSAPMKLLNRNALPASTLKPAVLELARRAGLRVPKTRVTNDIGALAARPDIDEWVAKPVNGGDYCRSLDVLRTTGSRGPSAMPGIVQNRLMGPELRLYVIGGTSVAFELSSPSLDYRELQDAKIREVEVPLEENVGLRHLMGSLRMDFGAADFKRDPASGAWTFMELNSCPMFALFDEICGGKICRAILRELS